MVTVSRKAKQKHPLQFFVMVWFHRIKIAVYLRLITNNYNLIGHNLAQNVRCLLCYQLIKNVSSEHVFYLLLFALYYFCIMLKTCFSSESDPDIIETPHHFPMQYCIYQKNFIFFSLLPTCVNRVQIWQTASVFFPCTNISQICLQMWNVPFAEQQHSIATWAALKENLFFNVGSLKVFLIAIANSHNSNVCLLTG